MISDVLEIRSVAVDGPNEYRFEFSGCIDVRADGVLGVLREVSPNSHVCLDFHGVERVNSMGLSLMLKIFQDWDQHGTRVEVINLNRMVGMLFKITGLGSYVKGDAGGKTPAPRPASKQPDSRSSLWSRLKTGNRSTDNQDTPASEGLSTVSNAAISRSATTLYFFAGFTNSFHRSGWLALSTFLQRKLQTAIRFEQCRRSPDSSAKSVDLFFSGAFDACSLIDSRGMVAVMRADGSAEQVVILAAADDTRPLSVNSGARVAVASQHSLVQYLGRSICDSKGLDSSGLEYIYSGNEIRALQMLIRRQVDLAFVMQKTYTGLSSFSRDSTKVLEQSDVSYSCPLFCIGSHLGGIRETICGVLGEMNLTEAGQKILNDIQVNGWSPSQSDEMDRLTGLIQRYSDP